MQSLLTGQALASFATLSAMEIVLGIDNIIFISILTSRLPAEQRAHGRRIGLAGALFTRIGLLFALSWLASLTTVLFSIGSIDFSGKSLVLAAGGLFLLYKATKEIHHKMELAGETPVDVKPKGGFWGVILQIMILDIVFSLDSVVTAVGMAPDLRIMIAANVVALGVMLAIGGVIANFVERHPSVKILALSFLMMIGLLLVVEAFEVHVPKGYVYFAMGFSVFVEFINIRVSARSKTKT